MKKTNFIYWALFICIGCSQPKYLETYDKIQNSRYGAKIKIYFKNSLSLNGELLAVTDSNLYVLSEKYERGRKNVLMQVIDKSSIDRFNIQHSNSKSTGAGIIVLPLIALSHGFVATLTIPVNIVTSSVLHGNSISELQYSNSEIEWKALYKFARFPQGLPPNVNLSDLLNRADPELYRINPVQYQE